MGTFPEIANLSVPILNKSRKAIKEEVLRLQVMQLQRKNFPKFIAILYTLSQNSQGSRIISSISTFLPTPRTRIHPDVLKCRSSKYWTRRLIKKETKPRKLLSITKFTHAETSRPLILKKLTPFFIKKNAGGKSPKPRTGKIKKYLHSRTADNPNKTNKINSKKSRREKAKRRSPIKYPPQCPMRTTWEYFARTPISP